MRAQADVLRVLTLADTHIGCDHALSPRVERRRRGPDFIANLDRALAPARAGEVDLVLHGGDLLDRSRLPAPLVQAALDPLLDVARRGIPVVLVPGNHERGRVPFPLLARHPHLHVLDAPRTVALEVRGLRVRVAGFPFVRRVDGGAFPDRVRATGAWGAAADIRLLLVHQAFETARVGVHEFVFRAGPEAVALCDVPPGFAAVVAGHVHRAQVLTVDARGRGLPAPVLVPGSVERTAFAERLEVKGCLRFDVVPSVVGGRVVDARFVPLPTRPMHVVCLEVEGARRADLEAALVTGLEGVPADAVVRLDVAGRPAPGAQRLLAASALRDLAPATMNVEVRWADERAIRRRRSHVAG